MNIYMTTNTGSVKPLGSICFQSRATASLLPGDSGGFLGNLLQTRWAVKVLVNLGNLLVLQDTDVPTVLLLGQLFSKNQLKPLWIQPSMPLLGMTGHTEMGSQSEITWGAVLGVRFLLCRSGALRDDLLHSKSGIPNHCPVRALHPMVVQPWTRVFQLSSLRWQGEIPERSKGRS